MAFSKCKGTVLSMSVSGVSTSVAQVIEITPPKSKSIDFEAETLDQSGVGVPRELTGYVDADAFSATLFWDPALASQAAIEGEISTPDKTTWSVTCADSGTTSISWTSAGLEFGAVIGTREGLKAELSGNIDGLPVYA
jgi:hypothetical protein